ncbi:MAG: glycosyltransferase [Bacteroidetes bacterium]|nr:MAG: glycosyltransferase [Bacteroidota bacterium]
MPSIPLFSILVANYNNGQYLEDCLKSIFAQTYKNWEIVIVDDASTDNSPDIYNKFIKHPRIKTFTNNKNEGCGFTKRECVNHASGDICGFVDADDALLPEALEKMVKAHLDNPDASVISSKFYYADLFLNKTNEGNIGERIPDGYSYLTYGKWAITHFATFKRSSYNKTEGIDPKFKMAVDQDLYLKLEEAGHPLFMDRFLYLYRITPQSISKKDKGYNAHLWYFQAVKDAYARRLENNPPAKNFSKEQFRHREYLFAKERIAYEKTHHRYIKKYYFLFKSMLLFPSLDIKYKMKCLLLPFYA